MKRLVCKLLGHTEPIERLGTIANAPALASFCGRCGVMVRLRSGSRADRRRARFGR